MFTQLPVPLAVAVEVPVLDELDVLEVLEVVDVG